MSRRQYMTKDPEKEAKILEWRHGYHPGGTPKKMLTDLPENWKEIILENMSVGASQIEVMAKLGISRTVWDRFLDEEPEFIAIVEQGTGLCEAWWMTEARNNLYNHKFQTVLWYMNMKNRFGWKDKAEVDYTSGGKAIMPQIMVFGISDPLNTKIQQLKEKDAAKVSLQLDSGSSST